MRLFGVKNKLPMSLKQKVLRSFKWSILGEVFSRMIDPLVFVVLAKILVPEDFGVVAAATVVISFSQVFWDAGLAKALIQRNQRIEEAATIVFWTNIALGGLLFLVLLLAAEYIALFFQDPRIANVVRVLGIQLPLAALCSVHTALKQREFHFEQLFWVRICTTTAPILASIPLALYGAGYWALVAGTLLGQLAQTIVLWKLSSWRPKLWFDRNLAGELFIFGRWVMLSALLGWFFLWMDAIIVGGFLGTRDLGLYRTGNALATLVLSLVVGPLIPVLYSLLSRVSGNMPKLREVVLFVERIVIISVLPIGMGLLVLKDIIPILIFRDEWIGIGEIIGIIGITQAISYTVSVKQEVYRSIGRPAVETKIMTVSMLIRLPFYFISIQYGLFAFVCARLISTLFGVINHLVFAKRIIQMRYRDFFKTFATTFLAALAMLFAGWGSNFMLGTEGDLILRTLSVVGVCLIFYGVLIYILEGPFIKKAYEVLKGRDIFVLKEEVNG